MRGFVTIYRRELMGLFLTPLAWILLCATLLYNGMYFLYFLEASGGNLNLALSSIYSEQFWLLAIFLPPLLTMRMISEETQNGILEFLLTAPVSDQSVIAGKMLAATSFMALAFGSGFLFAALCALLGGEPDWGTLFTGWLGTVMVSALFCAVGLVSSALCSTPILAAFLSILSNIMLLVIPMLGSQVGGVLREPVAWLVHKLHLSAHFKESFPKGALDSSHVIFFLAWILVLLFLAVRLVESRRWRG